ncbi:MAG: DUF4870 domain-containing protein [Schwartzia sp.]|nr:DUF4870 domain-containing protein [Schwartzia sp. (in: firmicutes)]
MNEITSKQRILAASAHAGFYLGGLGFLVLPFLIKTIWNDDDFVVGHAKQAFYMQLGAIFVSLAVIALAFIIPPMAATLAGIGFLAVAWAFFAIIGAVKAMEGEEFVYPALKMIHLE